MKKNKFFILISLVLPAAVIFSPTIRPVSLSAFVLKGVEPNIEAFKVDIFLNRKISTVEAIGLTQEQKKQAGDILRKKDSQALISFCGIFGKWPIVIGVPTADEGWPNFLGGGFNTFIHEGFQEYFDNLSWLDRFYLAMNTKVPPSPPFASSEIELDNATSASALPKDQVTSTDSNPKPSLQGGPLRVEILNGCGITNAADWVARRIEGPGIVIVDSGNADNFHYLKTVIRSSAGVPVALEDALERLGVQKDSTEEVATQPSPVDVVVIVGKDFLKLKERARERSHY